MRSLLTSFVLSAIALAATWPLTPPARADDLEDGDLKESGTAGALVGASALLFGVDFVSHSGTAVVQGQTAQAPPADVSGSFGLVRLTGGGLLRVTRFGSEAGIEGSMALGWSGDSAYGGAEKGGLIADISFGVVVVPFRAFSLGGFALKLNAGIGSDHDVDYLYAGARLGFGEESDDFGVEPAYLYRVGDGPGGITLTEHRIGLNARLWGLTLGLHLLFGEAIGYKKADAPNTPARQAFQGGTIRKGDYSDILFTLGYAWKFD